MKRIKEEAAESRAEKMERMTGHGDEPQDRKLVKKMVKSGALTGKAKGGPAKKQKPKTQVNVLIGSPDTGAQRQPVASGSALPPSRGAGEPVAGLGQLQPAMKKGGVVTDKGRGSEPRLTAGAGGARGRMQKAASYGHKKS